MGANRLLLTRPRAQAADWLGRLAHLGVPALSLPLLAIGPAADKGAGADRAWQDLPDAALAMFVSPNAVTHFFERRPAGQGWPQQTLAACVGPGSASALRAAGVPDALIRQPAADAPQLDSEHLWPQLEAQCWQGRLALILRGEGGRDWLSQRLRERGAEVREISVYRRGCPSLDDGEQALLDRALAAPRQHVWLFSSSEAIGHLRTLAGAGVDWSQARALATHPRIAAQAQALGFGAVVLTRPDAAAVAAAFAALDAPPLQ